jgi:hypothetical protein
MREYAGIDLPAVENFLFRVDALVSRVRAFSLAKVRRRGRAI